MPARDLEEFDNAPVAPMLIRLQRYLASCGLGSRRACEDFITMGRVTVDGEVITEQGKQINPQVHKIALDGQKLKMERKRYFVFNKPPGVLCTNKDPEGRPRVIDFFPKEGPRVFSVGRLDEDSEGLLIVTNDGDLAQKMAHPSYRIFRTYHVLVAGAPTPETLTDLRQGIYFEEGRFRVEGVKSIKKQGESTWCEVILAEGHNREVRRLFSRVGHKVMKLQRVAFGPINLGKMARGEIRDVRRDELERLFAMLEKNIESRKEDRESRPRQTPRPGTGTATGQRRMSDGDLLNKSSRNAPPSRNFPASRNAPTDRKAAPKRTGTSPERSPRTGSPSRGGAASRSGPASAPPKRPRDSESRGPREPRGLGIEEVSDEQMMGLVDRPGGRSGARSRPAADPGRPVGATKKPVSGGGPRRPDGERSEGARPKGVLGAKRSAVPDRRERRPADGTPFKSGNGTGAKTSKSAPAKAKGPKRDDRPTETFGRRSPGQPKRPKNKPPRGR